MKPSNSNSKTGEITCHTPEETFDLGTRLSRDLCAGDVVLLSGELGAGKTLLTKGILHGLGYDVDEVTSPSFTLVNLYKAAEINVYHIDLWRLDCETDAAAGVGLDEILEDPSAIAIIEWPDRLSAVPDAKRVIAVSIAGDGDDPRKIKIDFPFRSVTGDS
ncbi:MAG TPA: tRNA (adenosine(37)-N6)-threonylcarbamoyltransferase complex ATPase subunit type 1 TsaE [Pyrinomonadaceae bacterium]|nr:tRNA (adenosine(37)-N6)-threonylcarbamoyltransferase complex ATPase subunit type 1 TsaE [Pyrinomonadaceae bacterium]